MFRRAGYSLTLAAAALTAGLVGCDNQARAAGLLVADGGFGGKLAIQNHDVRVMVNNGIAVTEVEQTFLNTEDRIVEALYTFPVPKDASVSNFSMWISGKEMVGEVVEKQRARQIYESYKETRRDPGLLEQVDYKRFEMRIFPIAAGAEQRVRVVYYQELDFDHDQATYVYPLATTAAGVDAGTSGRLSFAIDVKSEVPLVDLVSPSHPDQFVVVPHGEGNYWQASLETPRGELTRDLVIHYSQERPHTGLDLITSKQASEDGYLQLTMTAGKELEGVTAGSDYVFVVDISGSMANDGKLATSRQAVEAFVQSLGEEDRFELMTFNIGVDPLFNEPTAVTPEAKTQAVEFLTSRRAMGGTVLRPALEAAYRYHDSDRQLNVVVLSDGMTEQGEQQELLRLIDSRPAGSSVFCVGVGNEVNRPLLGQLAQETGGLAAFVSAGDDFERQAQAFRRKLTRPAARNVKIAFEGVEVYDTEPAVLPSLYHGQPIRMYGRYKVGGNVQVRVTGEVLGSPFDQTFEMELPKQDDANPEVERMWAQRRVERLMSADRRTGSRQGVDEIVRLCEGYSITSEYASFIVLENDAEYKRWKIARRNVTREQRDRRARQEVREGLDRLRQQTAQSVGPKPAGDKPTDDKLATDERPQLVQADARPNPSTDFDFAPNVDATPSSGGESASSRSGGSGGGGGGAIDPFTALAAAGVGGLGWLGRRRRQSAKS